MHKLKYVVDGLKLIVAYCIAKILRLFKSNRDIWLIGERKDEAKDNGYHLFKYIRENHSEEKVYYIITRDSKDLEKIQKFGNIIYADTFIGPVSEGLRGRPALQGASGPCLRSCGLNQMSRATWSRVPVPAGSISNPT